MPDDPKQTTEPQQQQPEPKTNDESDWQRFSSLIDERVGAAVKREVGPTITEALKSWQPSGTSGAVPTTQTNADPPKQIPEPPKRSDQNKEARRGFLERAMGWRPPETTSQ